MPEKTENGAQSRSPRCRDGLSKPTAELAKREFLGRFPFLMQKEDISNLIHQPYHDFSPDRTPVQGRLVAPEGGRRDRNASTYHRATQFPPGYSSDNARHPLNWKSSTRLPELEDLWRDPSLGSVLHVEGS